MKATSIFIFGALICSAAARPAQRGGNNGGRKGGSFGGQNTGNGGAAAALPSAAVPAAAAAATTAAVAASTAAAAAAASTAAAATAGSGDLQSSLTLDPSVVAQGFSDDGQNPPVTGQSASSTSTNNYINFCALTLPAVPLTNGQQITTGSCNPAPIGLIPSVSNMPSAKFVNPKNGDTIAANTAFTAQLAVANFQTGVFTNAQKTYFAAPQTLNAQGQIVGHTHIVIEKLSSLAQTEPTDPTTFTFFKGVDDPAANGVASAAVTAGVPAGSYRICSINSSSNHQPVIVPIAQHGTLDDCSYFTAK